MTAKNVWFGNENWPSGRSPGDFAREVFRIEGCKTDKEKAFAFYTWFQRCMLRGPNLYQASGAGTYARVFDALSIFAWGSHECTGWGWVAAEALNAAGVKARRMVANANGHTFYEVWYKGDNGKEAWHAFDPFLGWYFPRCRYSTGKVWALFLTCSLPPISPINALSPLPKPLFFSAIRLFLFFSN